MATSNISSAPPGFRNVRDKYLALLLSDTQSQLSSATPPVPPPPPPPPPPQQQQHTATPGWTPGGKFSFHSGSAAPAATPAYSHHHATQGATWPPSPVTPAPTDADVRFAELTAGLVAAGDNEHRQSEAIRRLTGQLQKSERRIRHLESSTQQQQSNSSSRHHRSLSRPAEEEDHEYEEQKKKRKDPVMSAISSHRHRRSGGESSSRRVRLQYNDDSPIKSSGRPRSTPVPQHEQRESATTASTSSRRTRTRRASDIPLPDGMRVHETGASAFEEEELRKLRYERNEWILERQKSEKESESLSIMLADIKRNTQRLVRERDDHLQVIARLQDQLDSNSKSKKQSQFISPEPLSRHHPRRVSPTGFSSRSSSPARVDVTQINDDTVRHIRHDETMTSSSSTSGNGSHFPAYGGNSSRAVHVNENQMNDFRTRENHSINTVDNNPNVNDGDIGMRQKEKVSNEINECIEREQELQRELRVVVEENARLSERVPTLETDCVRLANRLRISESRLEQQQAIETTPSSGRRRSTDVMLKDMNKLIEEVDILEGVSDAIHFGTKQSDSITSTTNMNISSSAIIDSSAIMKDNQREDTTLREVVKRVANVRSSLSVRYGRWLEFVAQQTETHTQLNWNRPGLSSSRKGGVCETSGRGCSSETSGRGGGSETSGRGGGSETSGRRGGSETSGRRGGGETSGRGGGETSGRGGGEASHLSRSSRRLKTSKGSRSSRESGRSGGGSKRGSVGGEGTQEITMNTKVIDQLINDDS